MDSVWASRGMGQQAEGSWTTGAGKRAKVAGRTDETTQPRASARPARAPGRSARGRWTRRAASRFAREDSIRRGTCRRPALAAA